jgi:hypothetical protein
MGRRAQTDKGPRPLIHLHLEQTSKNQKKVNEILRKGAEDTQAVINKV